MEMSGFAHVFSYEIVTVTQNGAIGRINVADDQPVDALIQVSLNGTTSIPIGIRLAEENVAFTLPTTITPYGANALSRNKGAPAVTVNADLTDAITGSGSLLANTDVGGRQFGNAQTSLFLPAHMRPVQLGGDGGKEYILFLEDYDGLGTLDYDVSMWLWSPYG